MADRDCNEEARLEILARKGDLVAARALGRREAPYSVTTNLDDAPEGVADAYEQGRQEVNHAA